MSWTVLIAALADIRPSVSVEVVTHSRDLNPKWSRDPSFTGPIRLDQIDEYLPSGFPGIFALLNVAEDGKETIM